MCSARPSQAAAGRSSSPTRSRSWRSAIRPTGTAAADTACCSAAAVTTPATRSTICGRSSSSPASGPTWPASSCPGSASTSTTSSEPPPVSHNPASHHPEAGSPASHHPVSHPPVSHPPASHHPAGSGMESVDGHLAEILATVRPLPPVLLSLAETEGGVLAEDIAASTPLPAFDNSAVDGYAVQARDIEGATNEAPVTLPVTSEIAAGDTGSHQVTPGSCVRIMTGALLPPGADAVVPGEWTGGGPAPAAVPP